MIISVPNSPYLYSVHVFDGKQYRRTTKTTNRRAAQKVDDEFRKELEAKFSSGIQEIKVSDAVSRYLSFKNKSMEGPFEKISDFFGPDRNLSVVDSRFVHQFVEHMRHEKLMDSTIGIYLQRIKAVISWARKNKYAVQDIEYPRVKGSEKRIRFLSLEEEAKILAELSPDRQYVSNPEPKLRQNLYRQMQDSQDFFIMLLDTGTRLNELCTLRWKDVNIDEGTINLYRSKTRSYFVLHATNRVAAMLRRRYTEKLTQWVFPNEAGDGPRRRKNAAITHAIERAGLKDFHLHDLRHAAAVRMIRGGMTLLEVSAILGHSSIAMTERYSFVENEPTSRKMKKIFDDAQERLEQDRTSPWLKW